MALAMLGAIFLIFTTIEAERSEREQVALTNDVLIELRNVTRAAVNAETGQRGYMITLDRRYLDPYRMGNDQFGPSLERLRALIGANATQRQIVLLDEIEQLGNIKFAELEQTVELIEGGELMAARRIVLTDEGQESMQRLRSAIAEMEEIETEILNNAITETARSEARVLPMLGGLSVLLLLAILSTVRLVARTARAEAEASQAQALGEARDRADLLARELNHRVKNLFAVIMAIVKMSGRDRPDAKDLLDSINQRIGALLTAHEVTQGALDKPVASLRSLIETTLAPYCSDEVGAALDGPELFLDAKTVTPLGLVLHELTTNAVKYGAWSCDGNLEVTWSSDGGEVQIDWRETGLKQVPSSQREGFGSLLMTSSARQLRGAIDRRFTEDGVRVTISFPQ
ncbi:CHASE3 domain-containing protein [Altererythrobacter sp. MF3-039]|uniref:CHASE3 domain-containing protein n=1 Tax=Altererythrobacter sp. MF3-039 TaxID=3252901 RepID=UPI00390C5D99